MNFNLLSEPSLYVFIEYLLVKLDFHIKPNYDNVIKVVTYISKMLMHE